MKSLFSLRLCAFACNFILVFVLNAQYKIEVLDSNTFHLHEGVILSKTSFRGLSVVDDKTIWVSGSRGTIANSIDGGKTFSFQQLKGYEKSDFRDIEAFDDKRAIIMSSGTPAYILKTIDGGQTWKEVYKNTDTAYFLDAMDFWNDKKGMLVGDPVNGHFLLLQTNDGGETWQQLDTSKTPIAFPGEAVFAASGTSLRCWGRNDFGFVTGGTNSQFLFYSPKKKFQKIPTGITHGKNSKGAFSFSVDKKFIIIVGGDYTNDTLVETNSAASKNFYKALFNPFERYQDVIGFKSSVEIINKNITIALGTSGIDILRNVCAFGTRIQSIRKFSKESFHIVRKAKKGKAVFLAGAKGKIGKLIY